MERGLAQYPGAGGVVRIVAFDRDGRVAAELILPEHNYDATMGGQMQRWLDQHWDPDPIPENATGHRISRVLRFGRLMVDA
jgi:hypothetical protein